MAHVDEARVGRVLERLGQGHPSSQLLVTDSWSIFYLTGFYAEMFERFSGVLLAPGKRPAIFDNALYPIDSYDNEDVVVFNDTDDIASVLMEHIDPELPLRRFSSVRTRSRRPVRARTSANASSCARRAPSTTRSWLSCPRSCTRGLPSTRSPRRCSRCIGPAARRASRSRRS